MPWLKVGDNAATHPQVVAVGDLPGADDRSVNETFGFVVMCATQSAAHMTDYIVRAGTVRLFGGSNWPQLVKHATKVGLMRATKVDGAKAWILVDDPELFHIRLKADVQWDRQRDHDRKNTDLTMPVLLRDGDVCRFCDVVVNWRDHVGGRGGTFEHCEPGQPARLDTYVVCCRACNRERSNYPDAEQRRALLPPPAAPHYTTKTAERLTAFLGRTITASPARAATADTASHPRPGTQPVTAPRDPAPSRPPRTAVPKETAPASRPAPADTAPERSRPGTQPDTVPRDPAPSRPPRTDESPARPDIPPDTAHLAPVAPPDPESSPDKPRTFEVAPGAGRGGVGSGLAGAVASLVSPARPRPSPSDPNSIPGRRSRRGRRSR